MSAALLPPTLRPLRDKALGEQSFAVAPAWIAVGAFGIARHRHATA